MTKKTPLRSCTACQEKVDKRNLLRVVRSPEGVLQLDPSGKAPGRGAYICKDIACLEKAVKDQRLARALQTPLPETLIADLRAYLEESDHG